MREKFLQFWIYLRGVVGVPSLVIIVLLVSYFFYTSVRDWQLRRALDKQEARIEKYGEQSDAATNLANQYLQQSDETRQATLDLFAVVTNLTIDVKKISENDRMVTIRANKAKNAYENTRNQKNTVSRARANLPLRERESGALARDKQLYPD